MKKHIGRAWMAIMVLCFPLHAMIKILTARNESEAASFPFFGTECVVGFGLSAIAIASVVLLNGAQAAVIVALATVLYALAMANYFKRVLKAKGSAPV